MFEALSTAGNVTLRDLQISGKGVAGGTAFNLVRIANGTSGAMLDNVRMTGTDIDSATLVFSQGTTVITDSVLDANSGFGVVCAHARANVTMTITDTTFQDCATGVTTQQSDITLAINRSRFIGAGANFNYGLLLQGDDVNFRLDNSLIARDGDSGAILIDPGDASHVAGTINQSTVVTSAATVGLAVDDSDPGASADIDVYDSIFAGFPQFCVCDAVNLETHYSYYQLESSPAHDADLATDIDSDSALPGFVGIGPDPFALVATSVLRDKDSTANGFRAGEPTTGGDLLGNTRINNGSRDIGAYEFQFIPAVIPPVTPVVLPATPAFTGSFKFSKSKVKKGKSAKVSYSLTAPGSVSFKLKAAKKKNKVPKLKSAAGKAGANSYSISTKKLKAGKYTLTATLPSGASKSATLTVTK